jgi:hypothetical protein
VVFSQGIERASLAQSLPQYLATWFASGLEQLVHLVPLWSVALTARIVTINFASNFICVRCSF